MRTSEQHSLLALTRIGELIESLIEAIRLDLETQQLVPTK